MHGDLGITIIVFHLADGRVMPMRGGYLTSVIYSAPGLLWGAWRYLGNDNIKGARRWKANVIS